MRKIIATVLAVVMVACAFSTLSVSAAEGNLLAGLSYTATYNSFLGSCTDDNSTLLTDGAFRGDGTNAYNEASGVAGVTVEYAGTYQINVVEFAFEDATDIATIVLKNVRIASNRGFALDSVGVSTDGVNYTNVETTVTQTAVADAPQYAPTQGAEAVDQYFDITIAVAIEGAMGLKVAMGTNGQYVLQLDEIEAYAGAASEDPSSDEPSSDEPSSDEPSSADPSEDPSSAESSEDEVVVAEPTYTVTLTDNGDGTATIAVTVPDGIGNGKIVLATSEDLALVADSVASPILATVNAVDGVITASFASATTFAEGSVVVEADYTVAEGAELDASDIIVDEWKLGDGSAWLASNKDGDVNKVVVGVEEPSVDPSEDPSSDEPSSDDPSSDESVDSSEESKADNKTEGTGDAGIAVFAVLAVISAGAVVVLKKRA